jgi:hypothetical protein
MRLALKDWLLVVKMYVVKYRGYNAKPYIEVGVVYKRVRGEMQAVNFAGGHS